MPKCTKTQYLGTIAFGALLGIGATWVASRLTKTRERERWRWQCKAEFMEEIQQNAGVLQDRLAGGHMINDEDARQLEALTDNLRRQLGRLHPYQDLQRAVRDFAQSASTVIGDGGRPEEGKAAREKALAALKVHCDEVFRLSDKALET